MIRKIGFVVGWALCFCIQAIAKGFTTAYVDLGHQSAVIYRPAETTGKKTIGVVVMHSDQDYLNFIGNGELADRGYTVMATLPARTQILEAKLLNVKAVVNYLREQEGIKQVVLLGHSGGATVMTAYQLLAEQGKEALVGKLYTDYTDQLAQLPKADGLLLLDANWGLSSMTLFSLDPNVKEGQSGRTVGRQLNLGDSAIGYAEAGKTHYTEVFKQAFLAAQRDRMRHLTAMAQARLHAIEQGEGEYIDDEPFVAPGGSLVRFNNKLFPQDLGLMAHTREVWPLLSKEGVRHEVIHSVRAPMRPAYLTDQYGAALSTTVRGFLSSYALELEDDYAIEADGVRGVRWTSNINNPIGNVVGISVPLLCMGMTGSWEYLAAESIYQMATCTDKQLAFVEGAGHMLQADPAAERFQQTTYGDTVSRLFNYVDQWLSAPGRFLK
ncbi:MAG: alpha/beta hydrolase [Parabacteroides sp.]